MEYISTKEYAEAHGLSERTVRNYCVQGKISGAQLVGKTWTVPADAPLPSRKNARNSISPLLRSLREQREGRMKGGIYHRTQIDLTYNSNHIEGSRLTKEQTRYIFETNTIGVSDEAVRVDDVIETTNHFRELLKAYKSKVVVRFEYIVDVHHRFETINPFQDGNGRVGRLIMFKECLNHSIVPFIKLTN